MKIIGVGSHPVADEVWATTLQKKPNGARTLGRWQELYLTPIIEKYYDAAIFYAADLVSAEMLKDIPEGSRLFVAHHSNFPWASGISKWRKTNRMLAGYEVDYFVNEPHLIELIEEQGGRAFLLPRFISTGAMPKIHKEKTIPTLWYGNRWAEFAREFYEYCKLSHPYWISGGFFGKGGEALYEIDRRDALRILGMARDVWAIGVSQLEAKYLGARIHSYRDKELPFYDQRTIVPYTKKLLDEINLRRPGLGE